MPRMKLTQMQKAKSRQESLYRMLRGTAAEEKKSMTELAAVLEESKQKFCYRFNKQLLEPWELLMLFHELGITTEKIMNL